MKEVRLLKRKNTDYKKDAFCGPAIVEIKDGEVIKLYNEIPDGAKLVKKNISKEAFNRWSLKAKEKWKKD
jgi:hypothetical protein